MSGRAALALAALVLCCVPAGCAAADEPRTVPDETIEIFGPYTGIEADRFRETLQPFVEASGVDVRYVGSVDFVDDLRRRVGEANDPPDLAVVPQPGLIRQLAEDEQIVPLSATTATAVADHYPPAVAALADIDGTPYAVPFRIVVKSLVWYRPDVFAEHGWTPPATLTELDLLVEQIQAGSDLAPWCFTMGAGSSTGWAATDWVEDLVLRGAGADEYRDWAAGDVEFADPAIASAFARFHDLVLGTGRVAGGLTAVVDEPVEEASEPLLSDPPACALYKQADFAVSWMPDGTTIGPDGDVDWSVLPGISDSEEPSILVGGDQVVQFRRDPDVDSLLAYLAGPDAGASWARRGGFLSPKSSIPPETYPEDYLQALAAALGEAPALAFDASDQMPPEVGSGLLWQRITEWVAGVEDYPTFANEIDTALAGSAGGGP